MSATTSSRSSRFTAVAALAAFGLGGGLLTPLAANAEGSSAFAVRETGATKSITTPDGVQWAPATGFTAGARLASSGAAIAGTDNDALYQHQRWAMKGWTTAVPRAGEYRVRLHLAETYWTQTGRRIFDVTAEGATKAAGVDIVAAVGPKAAHVLEFTTTVDDGTLDLGFIARKDNVSIGAVEIVEVPRAVSETAPTAPVDFVSRMVASPTPVTDKAGNVWNRWSGTLGSTNLDNWMLKADIAGTEDDALYGSNVWDARGYALDVPGKGTYKVRVLMAEGTFWTPGRRVFDIAAEGVTKVSNIDITAAVGPLTAHEVNFTTEVNDGVLDLSFIKKVDNPLVSAIEVTSVGEITPTPINTRNHPGLPFPLYERSVYKTDIRDAPLASNGAAIGDYVAQEAASRYGGMAGFNTGNFAVGMNVAAPGTPRIDVVHSCAVDWGVPPNLFDGHGHFNSVPVPEDAISADGSDGQMTIYDPSTDQLWEFWKMEKNPNTGKWGACWGGRIDDWSTKEATFPDGFGASASGMAIAPGMVTFADVRRGRIDHALTLAVPTASSLGFSWPANRTDGNTTAPNAPYEGQRLRLRSDIDLDRYNLTPIGRMIAEAAQKYGFIVTDKSGAVAVSAESPKAIEAATGVNPWRDYLGSSSWATMRDFPWSELEALPIDYGKH